MSTVTELADELPAAVDEQYPLLAPRGRPEDRAGLSWLPDVSAAGLYPDDVHGLELFTEEWTDRSDGWSA